MSKAKSYKGFGETHGLREWARLLDVNKDTLRYWLTTKGKNIEEFAEMNGVQYQPKIDEGRTRVNRIAQAEELLEQLFARSGYDTELLATTLTPGKRIFTVFYDGEHVGAYNLDTGALTFTDGVSGIGLIKYPVPDPKLFRYPHGWEAHPETKRRLFESITAKAPADLSYPIT